MLYTGLYSAEFPVLRCLDTLGRVSVTITTLNIGTDRPLQIV